MEELVEELVEDVLLRSIALGALGLFSDVSDREPAELLDMISVTHRQGFKQFAQRAQDVTDLGPFIMSDGLEAEDWPDSKSVAGGVAREEDDKATVIVETLRSIQLSIPSLPHSRPASERLRL